MTENLVHQKETMDAESFLGFFRDMQDAGYKFPVFLSDTRVGFSVQRDYPEDIRFKPAENKKGEPDDIAVIWVIYDERRRQSVNNQIPIRIRVGTMSRYRAKHWDYDFQDDDSPTEESVRVSRQTPQPIEVNSFDDYFFDPVNLVFTDARGEKITPIEILDSVYKTHCNSVHPVFGLGLRSRKTLAEFVLKVFDASANGMMWILRYIFGRTLDDSFSRPGYLDGFLYQNFKKISVDSIEVLGYRASRRVIVVFCLLVVCGAVLFLPPEQGGYIASIINSEFLMIVHGLLLIYFLDEILPLAIFLLLNRVVFLRRMYFNYLFLRS